LALRVGHVYLLPCLGWKIALLLFFFIEVFLFFRFWFWGEGFFGILFSGTGKVRKGAEILVRREGIFGEVFPCLGWPALPLFFLFFGKEKREVVYTNNRLRTGTDKGNPTV